jgi:uncharacterized protein YlaI
MLDSKVGEMLDTEKDIVCDECDEVIDVKIESEKLKNNTKGYYFACNHCGEKYPFLTITPRGEKYLKRMHEMRKKSKEDPEFVKDPENVKRYQKCMEQYRKEITGPYKESDVK